MKVWISASSGLCATNNDCRRASAANSGECTSGTQIWIGRIPWARRRSRCSRTLWQDSGDGGLARPGRQGQVQRIARHLPARGPSGGVAPWQRASCAGACGGMAAPAGSGTAQPQGAVAGSRSPHRRARSSTGPGSAPGRAGAVRADVLAGYQCRVRAAQTTPISTWRP